MEKGRAFRAEGIARTKATMKRGMFEDLREGQRG